MENKELKVPSVAWLTLNRSCNNNCTWCYAQNAVHDKMEFQDAEMCVKTLAELGIRNIVIIGGEPTIYPHVLDIIKCIRNMGLKASMVSNGRRFSDKIFARQCVESGISGIDISLKALNKEEYIRNTKVDGFQECIDGYKNLIELGFRPTLSYVICKYDVDEVLRLKNLLEKNELDDITIQFVKPIVTDKPSDISMSLVEMGKLVSAIYEILETSSKHYRIEASFPLCLIDKNVRDSLIQKGKLLTCCHVQKGTGLVLDTKFRVLPCNHFVDMPYSDKQIGLWNKEEIIKFWNSDSVEKIRQKTRCYPSKKCITCNLWDVCGGGCFTRWLFENPENCTQEC